MNGTGLGGHCSLHTFDGEETNAAEGTPEGLPPSMRRWAMMSIGLAVAVTSFDSSIANVALPTIARDLHASASAVIWIVNAYQLTILASLLPLSSLGEAIGFRRVYVAGLGCFAVASLACACSRSLLALTAARALQGLGAAGVISVNSALIRHIYPARLLGRGIGLSAMVVSASAAAGPTVASAILSAGTWPWLFAVNLPVAAAAFLMAAKNLRIAQSFNGGFDAPSTVLTAAFLGLAIGGVQLASRTKAEAPFPLLIAVGLVAGLLLFRREARRPHPLFPFDLYRKRTFAVSVLVTIVAFTAQMLALVSLPFYLEGKLHRGPVETGLLITPWPAGIAITAPFAGWLSDRVAPTIFCGIGLLVLATGLVGLALLPGSAPAAQILLWTALCGGGFGLFQTPNNRLTVTSAPLDRAGAAGGMLGTARLGGQALGAAIAAAILRSGSGSDDVTMFTGAAVAAIAAVISLARLRKASGSSLRQSPGAGPGAAAGS